MKKLKKLSKGAISSVVEYYLDTVSCQKDFSSQVEYQHVTAIDSACRQHRRQQAGNTIILPRLTQGTVRHQHVWVVDQILAGKRQRRYFGSELEAAWFHAQSTMSLLKTVFLDLGEDKVWAEPTHEDCIQTLRKALDVSQISVQPAQPVQLAIPLSQAIQECVTSKETSQRRLKYTKALRAILNNFAKGRESTPIQSITTADIEAFLKPAKTAGTRSSLTNRLSTLFSFAVRKEWIAKNPVDPIERVTIEAPTPTILTVEQVEKLMGIVEQRMPDMLTNITLKLFAAVRPEEALKLVAENLNLDEGILTVPPSASKTRVRRIVHLKPAAIAWLKRAVQLGSPMNVTKMTHRRRMKVLTEAMGFKDWPRDVFRHSAISYWVAECRSAGEVALEAGNSEAVIKRHYLNQVTREAATRFWAIRPTSVPS